MFARGPQPSTSGREACSACRPLGRKRGAHVSVSVSAMAAAPLPRSTWFSKSKDGRTEKKMASDALLMGISSDAPESGSGAVIEQNEFGNAVADMLLSGGIPGDSSLGPTAAAQAARVKAIFASSGVRRRGAQRSAETFFRVTTGCPDVGADPLLQRMQTAARGALEQWVHRGGEGPSAITHIVVGSLTPPRSAPGPDVKIISALGLSSSSQRLPQHHLGCHGGFRSLSLAAEIARGNPAARVLVVYGDVLSMQGSFAPVTLTKADAISLSLYGDGAAAAVVSGAPADATRALARVAYGRSELLTTPDGGPTLQHMRLLMRFNRASQGFAMETLPLGADAAMAAAVCGGARAFLQRLAEGYQEGNPPGHTPQKTLDLSAAPVLLNAGGAEMAAAVAAALGLSSAQTEVSQRLLEERGNMSGASNLAALSRLLQQPAAGLAGVSHCVGLAYGEGVTQEGLVIELLHNNLAG